MKKSKNTKTALRILFGAITGFINGFFGGGAGMVVVPYLSRVENHSEKQSHATSLALIFPLCLISATTYFFKVGIDKITLIKVMPSFVLGGMVGSLCLKKLKNNTIKIIFSLVMIVCGMVLIKP